jgi:biotin operon repressor
MPYATIDTLPEIAQIACLLLEHGDFAPRELADATSQVLGRTVARIEPYIQRCREAGVDVRTERGPGRTSWYHLVRAPRYDREVAAAWAARCARVAAGLVRR